MAINVKCPKCGSSMVQLSNETRKHGCLFLLFFGALYLWWIMVKWIIGFVVFVMYDSWMSIVHKCMGKGHVWQAKRWFSNRRRIYFCHYCGYNFRA